MNDVQSLRRYRQAFYPQKNMGFGSGPKPKKQTLKSKFLDLKIFYLY
jgi:hypothetical protein